MLLDITDTEVKELESLAKKSNALVKLLEFYNKIEEDAIMNTYITNTIKLIEINEKVRNAKFDINDKEDKGFDSAIAALDLLRLKRNFSR